MRTSLLFALLSLACGVYLVLQTPLYAEVILVPDPHELDEIPTDCGNPEVGIRENELRAVACKEPFTGQWFQERAGGSSCLWTPQSPQDGACYIVPEPVPTTPEGATIEP